MSPDASSVKTTVPSASLVTFSFAHVACNVMIDRANIKINLFISFVCFFIFIGYLNPINYSASFDMKLQIVVV